MARRPAVRVLPRLLLAGLLFAGLTNCASPDRLAGPESPPTPDLELLDGTGLLGRGLGGSLLTCAPQPEVSAEQQIGPDGGTIQIGPHTLTVPAGALEAPVLITAVAPSDSAVSVRLSPEGLTFARPVRLSLSYAHCSLLARLLPKRIAYTSEPLEVLQLLQSVDDLLDQRVSAGLEHFSRYAVAW